MPPQRLGVGPEWFPGRTHDTASFEVGLRPDKVVEILVQAGSNYLFSEPGQRRDLRAERGALVPRKKVPETVAPQMKEGQREVARSDEGQDTFRVPVEQLRKVIRDLDEVRGDLAGVEEMQDTQEQDRLVWSLICRDLGPYLAVPVGPESGETSCVAVYPITHQRIGMLAATLLSVLVPNPIGCTQAPLPAARAREYVP